MMQWNESPVDLTCRRRPCCYKYERDLALRYIAILDAWRDMSIRVRLSPLQGRLRPWMAEYEPRMDASFGVPCKGLRRTRMRGFTA